MFARSWQSLACCPEIDFRPDASDEFGTTLRRAGIPREFTVNKAGPQNHDTVGSVASVRTVDHIAALISCVMRAADTSEKRAALCAKAWGLTDAYKQVPLSDVAYDMDAYLVVYCSATISTESFTLWFGGFRHCFLEGRPRHMEARHQTPVPDVVVIF